MAIAETNLNTDKYIIIEGYRWLGKPRQNKEGGGIGLLTENAIISLIPKYIKLGKMI